MSDRLLVWPASVAHPIKARRRHLAIPFMLRIAVGLSRAIFRGRGVGLACTIAAGLVSEGGYTAFRLGGGGYFLVPSDDRYWVQPLLLDRSYELDVDHFLERTLTAKDVFLDCGANLGLWSIVAARVIGDPERVVAIEAASRTFAGLLKNWKLNGEVFTVLHRAISDKTGDEVSFFASKEDHASATMLAELSPIKAQPEIVRTISLVDLLRQRTARSGEESVVFVKLDIEGMERKVLATIDPAQHRELIIIYEDHGSDQSQVTSFLLDRGFEVAFISEDGSIERIGSGDLHRLADIKVSSTKGYNFVAVVGQGSAASRLAKVYPQLELGWRT